MYKIILIEISRYYIVSKIILHILSATIFKIFVMLLLIASDLNSINEFKLNQKLHILKNK